MVPDGTMPPAVKNGTSPITARTVPNATPAPITPPDGSLRVFEDARREIADAATVDQVKRILAVATGLAAAARQATDREMEAEAAALKLEAERRLGQLMAAQRESIGLNTGTAGQGRPKLGGLSENPPKADDRPTLADAGIDKNLAHRARAAAAMTEPEFAKAVEIKREEFSQAEVKNVVENENTTEKLPRTRKSRSKAAKAKAAAEAEAKRVGDIAFKYQTQVGHLSELLAENPKRYRAILDHLANNADFIDALSRLVVDPAAAKVVAAVTTATASNAAPVSASMSAPTTSADPPLSPANAAELERLRAEVHELRRQLGARDAEIADFKAGAAQQAGAVDDRELGIKLTRLTRLEAEVADLRRERLSAAGIPELLAALKKKLHKAPIDAREALAVLTPKAMSHHKHREQD